MKPLHFAGWRVGRVLYVRNVRVVAGRAVNLWCSCFLVTKTDTVIVSISLHGGIMRICCEDVVFTQHQQAVLQLTQ